MSFHRKDKPELETVEPSRPRTRVEISLPAFDFLMVCVFVGVVAGLIVVALSR